MYTVRMDDGLIHWIEENWRGDKPYCEYDGEEDLNAPYIGHNVSSDHPDFCPACKVEHVTRKLKG